MTNFPKLVEIAKALYPYKTVRCHHVSIVLDKNRIISIASNSHKTHPDNLKYPKYNRQGNDISAYKGSCSEFLALKNIERTRRLVLVNIRIDNNLELNYSLKNSFTVSFSIYPVWIIPESCR